MGRLNNLSTNLSNTDDAGLRQFLSNALSQIIAVINGKLDFSDNVRTDGPISVTFVDTAVPVRIPHGLGRTPIGFWTSSIGAANIVYVPNKTSFPWTANQIYLQCNGILTAQVMIF